MRAYRRFSTLQQMGASLAVFAGLMLVLESGGLYEWAQRLELGPERSVALPLAAGLWRGMGWTGLERGRDRVLVALARSGWGDDPAAATVAAVAPVVKVQVPPVVLPAAPAGAGVPAGPSIPRPPRVIVEGDAPLVTELPAIPAVEAGGQRTVALAGDSMMAVGLSSTILRRVPEYKDLAVVKAFKSGTGLARPEVFNWQAEYPAMLREVRPDVVLVAIGANDGQGFVEGGVTYLFGTEGWKAVYRRRVEAYLQMLKSNGAMVVWLGLPPMKSGVYDARIALVNRIDYEVVSESPGAIWFSTATVVGDAQGRFQDYGSVDGQTARLRQADGIHLSDDGAVLVVERLLPWLAAQKNSDK
jgi:uncharacterized protein